MIDDELILGFIEESKEHLGVVESSLLTIEGTTFDKELINRAFRAVHTIKGNSGFFGFEEISSLSHSIEHVFVKIRDDLINPNPQLVSLLLRGIDLLSKMIHDKEYGKGMDASSVTALLGEADNAYATASLPDFSSAVTEPMEQSKETINSDVPEEESYKKNKMEISSALLDKEYSRKYLYSISLDFKIMRKRADQSKQELSSLINEMGEIISCDIPVQRLDQRKSGVTSLILNSDIEINTLACALGLNEDDIRIIKEQKKTDPVDEFPTEPENIFTDVPITFQKVSEQKKEVPLVKQKSTPAMKQFPDGESNSSVTSETIRVRVDLLDKIMILIGELVLGRNQLLRQYGNEKDNSLLISHSLRVSELQGNVMKTRLQPVGSLFSKFKRIVRDMALKLGKEITLTLEGVDVELDRSILENISDPLTHLIRNSADHGIESPEERKRNGKSVQGNIILSAAHDRGHVVIKIQDDGGGINVKRVKEKAISTKIITKERAEEISRHELVNLIFVPGFSTKDEVSQISGRGVGMDVVKTSFEKVGGSIDIKTEEGEGTCITVQLPLTLAIIQSIIVDVEGFRFAIPQIEVLEIVRIKKYNKNEHQIESIQGFPVYRLRGKLLPVLRLADALSIKRTFVDDSALVKEERRILIPDRREDEEIDNLIQDIERRDFSSDRRINPEIQRLMVLRFGVNLFGLLVDAVLDPEEIVVKPLPRHVASSKTFSGVTILGDGKVAMILDIGGIISASRFKFEALEESVSDYEEEQKRKALQEQQSILVFNNSETEFFAIPLSMISRIEKIESKKIEKIGEKEFIQMMDKNIKLLRLEEFLEIKPGNRTLKEIFIIIPNVVSEPFGIVATGINDVLETKVAISRESISAPGILGSFTVNGHMTLMLDLHTIFDMAIVKGNGAGNLKKTLQGKGYNVLLVEDTPFFRALEEGFFESAGFTVSVACDGKEALTLLQQNPEAFDAVVSDIEMPVMNGYELVKQIRSDEKSFHIPVIALTALAGKENEKKSRDAGFDAFEVKIDRENLIKRVCEVIKVKSWKKNDKV